MTSAKRGDRLAFLLVAVGLTIGHAVSYLIAIPDPVRREHVLERTGHGYLHIAGDFAVILAIAAVVTAALRALNEGPDAPSSTARLVWRVGAVQVAAFVAMEVGERVASQASLAEHLTDRILGIGILVQLIVAFVSVLVLRWIAIATARLAHVLSSSGPSPVGPWWLLPMPIGAIRSSVLSANGARAPPLR
jgi:hypothetical protein